MKRLAGLVVVCLGCAVVYAASQPRIVTTARLLVLNKEDATLVIVDPASGAITGTVPVGQGPHELVTSADGKFAFASKRSNRVKLTPDGKFALISDLDGGELVVVDAAARTALKRVPLGKMPEGILITPAGTRAFVAVNGDNYVAVVDLKTWQVTKKLQTGVGPDGMAWAR